MTGRVLVTGGAGYVGSHAAAALLDRGYDVVVADDLSTGHAAAVPDGARFVEIDIADEGRLIDLLGKHEVDAVLHFAARSLVGESMADPLGYFEHNVGGAGALLRAMSLAGVRRFILSSTANIFGSGDGSPLAETAPIAPGSPYGESKYMIERMLRWAEKAYGIHSVALRYFNAAGADPEGRRGEAHDPETHLIPILLQAALQQRDGVEIYGDDYSTPDGTCIRDYVHVDDLADAHIRALEALDEGCAPAYNLGTGCGHSVREVVDAVRAVTGADIPCRIAARRAGDPAVLVADPSKAMAELGWRPRYTRLEDVVETAWNWHRANPEGFREKAA